MLYYSYVDHFSRYAEAVPIKEMSAQTVASVLVHQFIARHGAPETLMTDQGTNFTSAVFKQTCRMLGIKNIQTTAYRPSADGRVERLHRHRTLFDSLKRYVNQRGSDWDLHINLVLAAYRSAVHSATGFSPNYLTFGRELSTPFDCDIKPKGFYNTCEEYPRELRRRLQEAHELAAENSLVRNAQSRESEQISHSKEI